MPFLGPISIFSRNYLFFGIIMCGHPKDAILCWKQFRIWSLGGRRGQYLARKSSFIYATPILSQFFGVRNIRLNGIISPPYPEVTLDNFGFLVGGRLAARRAVFQPPGRNLAILSNSHFPREVPLILDRGQRNLVGPSGPPIIWPTLINGPGQNGDARQSPARKSIPLLFPLENIAVFDP